MKQRHLLVRSTKKIGRLLRLILLFCFSILAINLLFNIAWKLPQNLHKPVDAFLVLGGSINREIYGAKLAKQYPNIPILISQGSDDPCVLLIFQREQAPIDRVLLEKCADSTFGNFFFSLPTLTKWKVHKVKLITSSTHLPRAIWLAKILLGAHGIATELDIAPERGIPGNNESRFKTVLDLTRSFGWTLASQVIQPYCPAVNQLADVDMEMWKEKGFTCERQGKLKY